jgi:hypothetical protein
LTDLLFTLSVIFKTLMGAQLRRPGAHQITENGA